MSLLRSSRLPPLQAWQHLYSPCPAAACAPIKSAHFSTSSTLEARNKGPRLDKRITLIRYFLQHPLQPRPLRFSRNRYLRHWTIHRAWNLYQANLRRKRELELERQYNSMREACEALRLMDSNGMVAEDVDESTSGQAPGRDVGRLYRIAMIKRGVWDGVPIEYARIQTDTPPRHGWNHDWTR